MPLITMEPAWKYVKLQTSLHPTGRHIKEFMQFSNTCSQHLTTYSFTLALALASWAPPVWCVRGGLGGIISLTLYQEKQNQKTLHSLQIYVFLHSTFKESGWERSEVCSSVALEHCAALSCKTPDVNSSTVHGYGPGRGKARKQLLREYLSCTFG